MGKKPVDRLEGLRIELNKKEREFLDDLAMRQTFKTGGSIIADLGSSASSILSAFTSGGDAGLLLALGGAYVVDSRLDLKSDQDLIDFISSINLYNDGPGYGIYPSVIPNRNGGYGGPVCFVNPADLPGDRYEYDDSRYGPRIPDTSGVNEPYQRIVDIYEENLANWEETMQTVPASQVNKPAKPVPPKPFNDPSWPWWNFIPGLTYSDPCPQDVNDYPVELMMRYNIHLVLGGTRRYDDIVFCWDDQIEHYSMLWTNLNPDAKYAMFLQGGGKGREEIDSLSDVLSAVNAAIPGMSQISDAVSTATDVVMDVGEGAVDLVKWGYKRYRKYKRYFANPTPEVTTSTTADTSTSTTGTETYYDEPAGYVEWPVWAHPPKSLYKFQTIHSTVEIVKILIPWYLGTKFAIEAAKAAGEIIPG